MAIAYDAGMAKLSPDITDLINRLKQQALNLVDAALAAELRIFEQFGETQQTLSYLDEMKHVADESTALYSRLSTLQLQIAQAQPEATSDMLELVDQTILRTQARVPALERSIQEVQIEWNLP